VSLACAPSPERTPEEQLVDFEDVDWREWLALVVPTVVTAPFAEHHVEFWEWLWGIEPGQRPDESFVGVWARGGAKSSSAEAGCVALGCRRRRFYGLYVCGTQDQADDHVGNVAALLEADSVALWYPGMADRLLGKFGNSRGWRRNRIRTASGFTLDALGLDTAARGVKLENERPDFMVFDDIDDALDGPAVVNRKIVALTNKLLPAGSNDVAVLAIQNLVHRNGVFARLVDGRARFLANRRVSGPIPAVRWLSTVHELVEGKPRDVVVRGEPTWAGQPLELVQQQIDDWGLPAFRSEAQHEVGGGEGALWVKDQLAIVRGNGHPDLATVVVAVDPSGGDGPDNDAQGIVACGRDAAGIGWVLEDATVRLPPRGWGDRAVEVFDEWDADGFVVELNYGGDMAIEVIAGALERVRGRLATQSAKATPNGKTVSLSFGDGSVATVFVVHASRGKRVRAEPIAALYGRPDEPDTWSTARVHHAGHFPELEDEMTDWRPDSGWSPNRMDAAVWGLTHLMVDAPRRGRRRSIVSTGAVA
jgi:hypothetical protein